jgi:phospholipase/carboxylesterase
MNYLLIIILILKITAMLNIGEEMVLKYIVREPKVKTIKPPLMIMLHGVGSNEKDLFSFSSHIPDKFLVVSARAPITFNEGSYGWYEVDFSTGKPVINKEQAERSRKIIIQFLEQLKQKHQFDESQVYLTGFSQGAIMAYSVGLTTPEKIKGIAILSGRLLDEVKPLIADKEKIRNLKVFISHGSADNTLVVKYSREANAFLKVLELTPTYKEYPVAHTITNEIVADLVQWLNK